MTKQTKLICTIGPASESKTTLKKLIKAGMNAVRLNFSHGSYDSFTQMIENTRQAAKESNTHVAIIQDLQGPKIRIGSTGDNSINLKKNQTIVLNTAINTPKLDKDNLQHIPLQYKNLPADVKTNQPLLIDDGKVQTKVIKVNSSKTKIFCKVLNTGVLTSNKGINAPETDLSIPHVTKKDLQDLKFGIKHNVDYIALSFVRTVDDILYYKNKLKKTEIKIIAKIERPEALENLHEIIHESDAVMIARGDLGIEIPAAQVPLAQKQITHVANKLGKPVILATHVLNSMVTSPVPTRAEISDAATAVFDQTDSIMLSNETAVGQYPVQACQTLQNVALTIEPTLSQHWNWHNRNIELETLDAICNHAVRLALDIKARYIVILSESGYTVRHISKNRSTTEMIVITSSKKTQNQLSIVWGVHHVFYEKKLNYKNPIDQIRKILTKNKLVKKDDEIVIVNTSFSGQERIITTFEV